MFRKRKEAKSDAQPQDAQPQDAQPQPQPQPQAPSRSGGYNRSELTTFDGKGNPSVIVYSTDNVGRTVKTRMGKRRGGH